MNNEYENLISKFYDLTTEEKKKEILDESLRIASILDKVSLFTKDPSSNKQIEYNPNNEDSEDDNLTKIYNNLLILEEKLVYYLKDKGY